MIYAATAVYIIEKKFLNVSLWFFTASVFSFFGVIHAFKLTEHSIDPIIGWNAAPNFALLYLLISGTLLALHCIVILIQNPVKLQIDLIAAAF